MTKTRLVTLLTSFCLLVGLFVVLPGLGADDKGKGSRDGLYRPLSLFAEVVSLVRTNYVEKTEVKPLLSGAFAGMTEAMDPYSEYVPPDKLAAFETARSLKDKGEAVDAGLVLGRRGGYPVVVAAVAGSPAEAAGLKTDDILEKVGDRSARDLALWEVDALLAGKPGGKVRLLVVRDAKPRRRTVEVVRASWTPARPSAARHGGETVLRVPAFAPGAAKEIAGLLAPLDRTKALVLDLRGNASGSLDEAARAAALFVPPGPLGELKGRKAAPKSWTAEPGERLHEGRIALLVDSGTGGPGELFAAALRDAAARDAGLEGEKPKKEPEEGEGTKVLSPAEKRKLRVRLVGEPTSGMGIAQDVVKLQSGGALRLTVAKLRGPSGRALSPRGLDPDDRVFPLGTDEASAPNAPDPILERGVKVLGEGTAEPAKAAS